MKIEIRQIRVSKAQSQETTAFTAVLFIDGSAVADCRNAGDGGATCFYAKSAKLAVVLRAAETFCENLPAVTIGESSMPNALEHLVDDLLYNHLQAEDLKKHLKGMEKKMSKGIAFGVLGSDYSYLPFNQTIEQIVSLNKGKLFLANVIRTKILPALRAGESILNTNIPADVLAMAKL